MRKSKGHTPCSYAQDVVGTGLMCIPQFFYIPSNSPLLISACVEQRITSFFGGETVDQHGEILEMPAGSFPLPPPIEEGEGRVRVVEGKSTL